MRIPKVYLETTLFNFQHIVKHKTVKMTGYINALNGYRAIEICSPMEVVENENA